MSGLRWSEEKWREWKERELASSPKPLPPLPPPKPGSARIILPWPPSGNHGTKHANGAHYLTREHIEYRRLVLELVAGMRIQEIGGRLRVELRIAPPDKRRRDLDNTAKVILDALQHAGVYIDDGAVDELHLYRTPVVKGGAVSALIESLA